MYFFPKFIDKFSETLKAVFPILVIVLVLCFTIAPLPPSILVTFLLGAVLLIMGMLFFNVGVESAMTPIGERVGAIMTRLKNAFNMTLILAVALGVGAFLVISILRMLFGIPLSYLLLIFYGIIFCLTIFVPKDFLAVAFDSGGVAETEQFMGVTIAAEKEIVYIVSKSTEKNGIMKAIMEKAGLNSKAKAICFSLPVTDTAGLRLIED